MVGNYVRGSFGSLHYQGALDRTRRIAFFLRRLRLPLRTEAPYENEEAKIRMRQLGLDD